MIWWAPGGNRLLFCNSNRRGRKDMLSQDNFCDHFDSDCLHLESYFIFKKNNLSIDFVSSSITFFPVKVPQCKIMYNFGHEKSKIIHLSYFYMILRPK